MKKLISIVLLTAILCLVGCNNTENDSDNSNDNSDEIIHLSERTISEFSYNYYRAIEKEFNYSIIVGEPVIIEEEYMGKTRVQYTVNIDDRYTEGARYLMVTEVEYVSIQRYQNETGKQIIYPTVYEKDRPKLMVYKYDANIYYKTEEKNGRLYHIFDENGELIPIYWKCEAGKEIARIAPYNSLRIEGADGFEENGKTYFYVYGALKDADGNIEIRVNYKEYLTYRDGISNTE